MNDEQLTITTAEREAMRADAKEIAREGCVYHSTPVVLALQVLRLLAALEAAESIPPPAPPAESES